MILDVSRETIERLEDYASELVRWSKKINLISPSTYLDVWQRHILDSAQAHTFVFPTDHVVDFGSGGGLPGLVLALISKEISPDAKITLIESDLRKATFLRQIKHRHDLNVEVQSMRVEECKPQEASVATARAITALPLLLDYTYRHLRPKGKAVLHKGKIWESEVAEAKKTWAFSLDVHQSTSDNAGVILEIGDLTRV